MRRQVVQAAHDELGHFAAEKTLQRLCQNYWFPHMRKYVEKYLSCCIRCLFNKQNAGRAEGFRHPIPKTEEPMGMLHVYHLGPFPKSKAGNLYIIVLVDGFTKFSFLKAVKSTKTKLVIEFFKDVFSVYGWDSNGRQVQFALNNHVNKSTGKSPSYLLFGMNPRSGSDMVLKDEIIQNTAELLGNLCDIRQVAREHIRKE